MAKTGLEPGTCYLLSVRLLHLEIKPRRTQPLLNLHLNYFPMWDTTSISMGAKSKIGHHCDGQNFFFQLSLCSCQELKNFMTHITWTNNQCTPQTHQRGATIIKHITVATHLEVPQMEFCTEILSVARTHFQLSCFSSCVILHLRLHYTIKQATYFNKKGKIDPQLNTLPWQHNH